MTGPHPAQAPVEPINLEVKQGDESAAVLHVPGQLAIDIADHIGNAAG